MTKSELQVLLTLKDQATKELKRFQYTAEKAGKLIKKAWLPVTAAVTGTVFAYTKSTTALIETSSTVEQLKIRLEGLLGSVEEGNKVFNDMTVLAGNVPKTYDEIMESATNLSAVVKGGSDEIKRLMPIIVDISAATSISVQDVTSQMIRMYSAGAASADMFRERGVSAALGFQAGVSYSATETINTIIKQWEDGTGKFVGAAQKLADIWEGQVSMMQDAWFQLKVEVGKPIFQEVKTDLKAVLELIQESKEEGGKYDDVVKALQDHFVAAYDTAKDFISMTLVGGANLADAFNEVNSALANISFSISAVHLGFLRLRAFGKSEDLKKQLGLDVALEVAEETYDDLARISQEARDKADIDYSQNLQKEIDTLKAALKLKKEEIDKNEKSTTQVVKQEIAQRDKARTESWQAETKLWIETNKSYIEATLSMGNTTATIMGELATMTGETWLKGAEIVINSVVEVVKIIVAAINSTLGPLGWLKAALEITAVTLAAANAFAQIESQRKALSQLKSQAATPTVNVPALADGGNILVPGRAIVGERGPEEVWLPRGATVTPLSKSRAGAGIMINIEINNPVVSSSDNIDELVEEISNRIAREAERI